MQTCSPAVGLAWGLGPPAAQPRGPRTAEAQWLPWNAGPPGDSPQAPGTAWVPGRLVALCLVVLAL